ncbi:hypothetical protein MNBD_GAMMA22-989 [hydrothermal vent metagenome]|uniref:Uncharacterized protein n=1 Tax=hydrothermal vent metagenome TaxID=652676 RepID=A0A3B1ARY1_9ZZZZ
MKLVLQIISFLIVVSSMSNTVFATHNSKIQIKNINTKYTQCMSESPSVTGVTLCGLDSVCRVTNLIRYFKKEAHNLACMNKFGGPELIYFYSDDEAEITH